MRNRLIVFCLAGLVAGSGCSFPSANVSRSTSESVSVSEGNKNGPCVAAVTVQESVGGKKHTRHQANVPCANVKAVQDTLAAQAKQGL